MSTSKPSFDHSLDLRCYFVTGHADTDRIVEVAREAARGGVGVIQVRSKPISALDLLRLTEQIATEVAQVNPATKVIVDDRVDVALVLRNASVPVHGVHLGQDDIPVTEARKLLGPDAIIGLTTGTLELVKEAQKVADVIDYIGAGPFRPTPTKDSGRPPIGFAGYPELVKQSPVPVVAIGDVQPADVPELSRTGIAGVVLVRAFMNSVDPAKTARNIRKEFNYV